MKRTQVQLEDEAFEALRQKAFTTGRSLAAVVREAVNQYLGRAPAKKRKLRFEDLTWLRSGRSEGSGPGDIGERHDDYLPDAFLAQEFPE